MERSAAGGDGAAEGVPGNAPGRPDVDWRSEKGGREGVAVGDGERPAKLRV